MLKSLRQSALFWLAMSSQAIGQIVDSYDALMDRMPGVFADLDMQIVKLTRASELDWPRLPGFGDVSSEGLVAPEVEDMPAAHLSLIDLRVALVQLSIFAGTNDQLSVIRAQPGDAPKVIAIQGGSVDLSQVIRWIAEQDDADALFANDAMQVPVLILEGARLVISADEYLQLGRENGAFLLNLGTLVIDGGGIAGTIADNPKVPEFRPFAVTAGSGRAVVHDAQISHLGFGKTAAFSGFAVLNKGLYPQIGPSFVSGSVLRDVGSLTFVGSTDLRVERNVFVDAPNMAVLLNGTENALVRENILTATQSGAALRVINGANRTRIQNNIVYRNEGTGISVVRGSENSVITGNFIWRNNSVGITVSRADCTSVANNISTENLKKGLEIRTSRAASITGNMLLANRSVGLAVMDQPVGTDTTVTDNVFVHNRVGLASASPHILTLSENDFSRQLPRLVEGDVSAEAHQIIADLTGTTEIQFNVGGIEAFRPFSGNCDAERDS